MTGELIEKHQLAGLDERARGFSRLIDITRLEGTSRATLRYEAMNYLGSRESWVEYPDPARPAETSEGRLRWLTRLCRVFQHG